MGCCANTFRREPTCPRTHRSDSSRWPPSSTTGPVKPWAASPPHKRCNAYCWTPNHPSLRRPPEFAIPLRNMIGPPLKASSVACCK